MGAGLIVVDSDVDAFGNLKCGGIFPCFCHSCAQNLDLLRELFGCRTTSSKEAVAVTKRATHCIWMAATDPQRRVGLLERFRVHRCAVELPEAASESDARFGPAELHQLYSFGEASDEAGGINLER